MLSADSIVDILHNLVVTCLLATGLLIVIIAKGIDLSIGAIMGFVTLVVAKMAVAGMPLWILVLVGIGVGIVLGAINGFLVTVVKLPAIIATLGTLSIYSGFMFVITNGLWITELPRTLTILGKFKVLGIPGRLIILALILIIIAVLLHYTKFGRYIYAVGNNVKAATLAGVPERPIVFSTYAIAGVIAAIAGLLYVSYTGLTTPTLGVDMQMEALAAAIIGGASIFGGKGTPAGSLLGALLLVLIASALVFFHLPAIWNKVAEGLVILVAVVIDAVLDKNTGKIGG
jgi:ribose/xylose/arabinose/galactoside ABC-type transport system permease subunit